MKSFFHAVGSRVVHVCTTMNTSRIFSSLFQYILLTYFAVSLAARKPAASAPSGLGAVSLAARKPAASAPSGLGAVSLAARKPAASDSSGLGAACLAAGKPTASLPSGLGELCLGVFVL